GRITSKLTLSYFTSDINAEIKEISTSKEFNPINQDPMKIIYNDNFPKPDESKILELILTSKETSSNASLFKDLLIETNKGFLMPIGVDILAKDSNTVSNVLFTYSNTKDFKLPSEGSFKSPSDMSELRAELSCDKSSTQESNVLNAYKGGNFLKCDEIGANFKIKLFGLELKDIKNITHLNTGVDGANITKIDFLIKENDNEVFKKLDWTDFKTTLYKKGFLDENSDKNFISLDISSTKPPCCFSALSLYKNNTLLKPKFASVYDENCVEVIFSTDEGLENPKNYLPSIPSNYKLLENECRISLESKEAYDAGYGVQELIYQNFGYQNGRSYYCAKRDDNTDLITIRALEGIKIDEISHFTFLNGISSSYPNSYLVTKMIVKKFNENKEMSFNTTLNDLVFQNTQSYQVNLSKTTTTSKTRSKK
ncbi:hypothetical protein, partial [Campylobacter sp. US33a]|uniref:hypothetical protein n=1 Tax=Campylobacter sp. US33a TaxID=2498120 RepID=UPI0014195A74